MSVTKVARALAAASFALAAAGVSIGSVALIPLGLALYAGAKVYEQHTA